MRSQRPGGHYAEMDIKAGLTVYALFHYATHTVKGRVQRGSLPSSLDGSQVLQHVSQEAQHTVEDYTTVH